MNLAKLNKLTLHLFNVVVSNEIKKNKSLAKEKAIMKEYGVVLTNNASYAINQIKIHCEKNLKNVNELNSTFYRSFDDILKKNRFELLIDQILHYITTSGTDFYTEFDYIYIPARYVKLSINEEGIKFPIRVIQGLNKEDIVLKVMNLLSSGVALKQQTIEDLVEVLNILGELKSNIKDIKNREAIILIANKYNIINNLTPDEVVRFLVLKATNESLLIKNEATIAKIKDSKLDIAKILNGYNLKLLAENFNRYKPLYLAFKNTNKKNKSIVNKISKLSKTYHKPIFNNPLNRVSEKVFDQDDLVFIKKAALPLLIRAYDATLIKSNYCDSAMFNIRNGKSWILEKKVELNNKAIDISKKNAEFLKNIIIERLSSHFNGKTFFIPKEIEYGLPLSEKNMCGNIPNNTIITTEDLLSVGTFWNVDYNVLDLDLSGISVNGDKIGWNDQYNYQDTVVYSGDIRQPTENGAIEYLLFLNKTNNDNRQIFEITVNNYSGYSTDQYKYDIVVGISSEKEDVSVKSMLNPANLIFSGERKTNKLQNSLGVVIIEDNVKKFIFKPSDSYNLKVSKNNTIRQKVVSEYLSHKIKYGLTLNKLIKLLGGNIVYKKEGEEMIDYDLSPTNITKDFFNLFYV